jgi:hypothetical protein
MKKIIIFILFFLSCYFLYSENNFRNTKWGMSKKEVKKTEKLQIAQEDADSIYYYTQIDNSDLMLYYLFVNDKLYEGGYMTYAKGSATYSQQQYFDIYDKFKKILTEKYSSPTTDEKKELPNDENSARYRDMPLFYGRISYTTTWDLDDIKILLEVFGKDMIPYVMVHYTNKNLYNLMKQKNQKDLKDKF